MDAAISAETRKTTRLDVRVRPDVKTIIEQAADILGVSITDFASMTLVAEAQSVLARSRRIVLDDEDRDRFLRSLEADDDPNEALAKAAHDFHSRHEKGARGSGNVPRV